MAHAAVHTPCLNSVRRK